MCLVKPKMCIQTIYTLGKKEIIKFGAKNKQTKKDICLCLYLLPLTKHHRTVGTVVVSAAQQG